MNDVQSRIFTSLISYLLRSILEKYGVDEVRSILGKVLASVENTVELSENRYDDLLLPLIDYLQALLSIHDAVVDSSSS